MNYEEIKKTLKYASTKSPFYSEKLKGIVNKDFLDNFNDINFRALPFTSKDDIAKNNNAFCCVPKSEISEYVTTSGTSGNPITIFLTKKDLDRLSENEKFSLTLMNGSSNDTFQLLLTRAIFITYRLLGLKKTRSLKADYLNQFE